MGETTGISWCDATLNFWIGCTKVSDACTFCYAQTWAERFPATRGLWGAHAPRKKVRGALAKAKKIARTYPGQRPLVFSNSLSDIFDNAVPIEWVAEAFAVMRATPDSIYLLLTKRPGNIIARSEAAGGLPPNVMLGCTVINQPEIDRDVTKMLQAKHVTGALGAFISIEPALGDCDLEYPEGVWPNGPPMCCGGFECGCMGKPTDPPLIHGLDWVIAGGESGVQARPSHPDWFRSLRDQCAAWRVPFHFKQWGEWIDHDQPGVDMLGTERSPLHFWTEAHASVRIGKKAAGRTLDGVIHNDRPDVARQIGASA